jgi:outer membrane receptor protein involved in Fe transport
VACTCSTNATRWTASTTTLAPPADALVSTRQTNRAYALFGSVNYELTRRVKLRGGLRYTQDKKTLATTGKVDTSQRHQRQHRRQAS